ncbi:MAG: GMP synthase (glutamine-hydrolyzing), partial [Phycisphaerales bacterium]|nr:GMP synthase (glutamine-hydrolyzing) [Phycisphaerales bacterium]
MNSKTPPPSAIPQQQTVAILDFGTQYAQLIARRVREAGVYSMLVRPDVSIDELRKWNLVGLILSGGPASVYEKGAPRCDPRIFELGVPILGICYGMQIATQLLGGDVKPAVAREYGRVKLVVAAAAGGGDGFFRGVPAVTGRRMRRGVRCRAL